MTETLARPVRDDLIEQVVIQGNLSNLTSDQRAAYYAKVCQSLGLNPYTRPFEYLTLQAGKLTLYARKDATDQLRSLRRVSLTITARETVGDLYVVTARAQLPDGRTDEEIGAVPIKGLGGEALANAYMKASTKAKRRVTLSICGLGMLDETEIETIPGARVVHDEPTPIDRPLRGPAIAAALDADLAETDAFLNEPIQASSGEQEETGELPGPRWARTPRGLEAAALYEELMAANQARTARGMHPIHRLMPADTATDAEVEQWIAAARRSLKALEQAQR